MPRTSASGKSTWYRDAESGDAKGDLLVQLSTSTGCSYLYPCGDTGTASYSTGNDAQVYCNAASAAGDFNATSGADDWLCGWGNTSSYVGAAYVYTGTGPTTLATLPGESAYDYAGSAVAGGGDVDGDGYDDIWIGAYGDGDSASDAGAAYLVYAPVTGTFNLSGADAKIRGDASGDYLGAKINMPTYVDDDGHDDVLVVAYYVDTSASNAGAVYLITDPVTGTAASPAGATILGEDPSDQMGNRGIHSGDFDGDGEVDLLVGAQGNDDGAADAGAFWVVYGPLTGTINLSSADAEWLGTNASDALGYAGAVIPDTNGDGTDELAMGAYLGDERGYVNHGAVWIWQGL